jgi:hypothetical protein
MNSRNISSHYILLPGGVFGKWPVVRFASDGTILSVETKPNGFKEEPGLEFFGGILIPGLVDIAAVNEDYLPSYQEKNRHFSGGTLVLGVNNIDAQVDASVSTFPLNHLCIPSSDPPHPFLNRYGTIASQKPILHRLIGSLTHSDSKELAKLLYLASEWGANQTSFYGKFGKLEPGFSPGLIVLQNLDLKKMVPASTTSIKWLIVPK